MNKKCFAPRKYFTKNNEVVYYLPAKAEILMPLTDNENNTEYWVKYCNEGIKTNILTTNKNDVTSAIFDDFYDCFDYCKNVNNVIFEPFATSCNYKIYKNDVELLIQASKNIESNKTYDKNNSQNNNEIDKFNCLDEENVLEK